MLLCIRNLDILDHLQLDIYACVHYSFNQRLLVIYHILGIYKDKANNLQFSFTLQDFSFFSLKFWDLSKHQREKKTTNNIYNFDSVQQVNCWKTQILPYYHTNNFSFCFLFTLCAVNSFTLIKYLTEYLCVESLFFSLPLHFPNSLPLTLFLLFLILYSLYLPISQVYQHWSWARMNTKGALRI